MICRYIFTREEYFRVFSMVRWRQLRLAVILTISILLIIFYSAFSELSQAAAARDIGILDLRTSYLLNYALGFSPVFVFLLCLYAFLLTPAFACYSYWIYFRKGPFAGKELLYGIHDLGITLQTTGLEQRINWELVTQAREVRNGYLLSFTRRGSHWLPKSGFASAVEIDQCRELIRAHVKKVVGFEPAP